MASGRPSARTVLLTALAMLAFAANSLLCRQALGDEAQNPSGGEAGGDGRQQRHVMHALM